MTYRLQDFDQLTTHVFIIKKLVDGSVEQISWLVSTCGEDWLLKV